MIHTREEQMEAFGRFLDILDELRVKCPWDRKQTNESLRPNTIEETYELCDALMRDVSKAVEKMLDDLGVPAQNRSMQRSVRRQETSTSKMSVTSCATN